LRGLRGTRWRTRGARRKGSPSLKERGTPTGGACTARGADRTRSPGPPRQTTLKTMNRPRGRTHPMSQRATRTASSCGDAFLRHTFRPTALDCGGDTIPTTHLWGRRVAESGKSAGSGSDGPQGRSRPMARTRRRLETGVVLPRLAPSPRRIPASPGPRRSLASTPSRPPPGAWTTGGGRALAPTPWAPTIDSMTSMVSSDRRFFSSFFFAICCYVTGMRTVSRVWFLKSIERVIVCRRRFCRCWGRVREGRGDGTCRLKHQALVQWGAA